MQDTFANTFYTANGTETVYTWGWQLENGTTATSFIVTSGGPVTRAADVASISYTIPMSSITVTTPNLGPLTYPATNLIPYGESYQFQVSAAYGLVAASPTQLAPDGSYTATIIQEDTTTGRHSLNYYNTVTSGRSVSGYFKAGTGRYVTVAIASATGPSIVMGVFDLITGTVTKLQVDAGYTNPKAIITPLANGWYRCGVTAVSSVYTDNYCTWGLSNVPNPTTSGGNVLYTGTGNYIYGWGLQSEPVAAISGYVNTNYVGSIIPVPPFNLGATQTTNYCPNSNAPNNITAGTSTSNATIAPDGTTTAQLFVANGTSATHSIGIYTFNSPSSTTVTGSVYVKKGTTNYFNLDIRDTNNSAEVYGAFDFSGATATTTTVLNSVTNASATLTPVGNGWYRATVTATFPSTFVYGGIFVLPCDAFGVAFNSTTSSIYTFGFQLETGSQATSYVPNTGTGNATSPLNPWVGQNITSVVVQ
jgi:hypothetical protein